ncbi:MAG: CDP-diacylglycerol--glycerol-3-phosphate 3-phosphatidyltransferase [Oscillospiraceae bacterium]
MNTPNKLTIFRIILAPFFLLFLLGDFIPLHYLWALIIFSVASITDAIDGHLARKHQLITNFGKFLDPLADKILVFSALIAFIDLGYAGSVAIVIMMAREFLVTSLRLIASDNGTVIAASSLGKLKTVLTMVSIIAVLALSAFSEMTAIVIDIASISNILIWVSAAITLLSGAEYLWKNRQQLKFSK